MIKTKNETANEQWDIVINADKNKGISINWQELWQYRDMIWVLIRKEIVAAHLQTVLGPLWYVGKAVIMALTFALVFGMIARVNPTGVPHMLFFMSGLMFWEYFLNCMNKTGNVLRENKAIFEKVYVPRLAFPIAKLVAGLVPAFFELMTLVVAYLIYVFWVGSPVRPSWGVVYIPFLFLIIGGIGSSLGLIISALTIKYRDIAMLISYSTRLLMYTTPIIYPMQIVPKEFLPYLSLNPLAAIIDYGKHFLFNIPVYCTTTPLYSVGCLLVIFLIGIFLFNRVERDFVDTV
ncbi:MAG: ABC transporter permease [Chitinophagales bacterium]|nr:ABC transporter permease [Bacteroidota bacterium]MCB9042747.1 ABC transporter permease [Chitinophagales bacterium]